MKTQGLDVGTMLIFVDCKSKGIDTNPVCIKKIMIGQMWLKGSQLNQE
jgi:hypothetical protein